MTFRLIALCSTVVLVLSIACGAQVGEQVAAAPDPAGDAPTETAATPDAASVPPAPATAAAVETKTAPVAAAGTVRLGEKVMEVTSSVAVWDTKNQQIEVYLYPFELTPEDIEKARTLGDIFVVFGKSSPNPEFWPDWSPLATVRFGLQPGTTTITQDRIKSIGVVLGWISEKNNSFSSHYAAAPIPPNSLEGSTVAGETVTVHVEGEISSSRATVTYDLSAHTKVLHCGPPRCPE